MIGTQGVIFHWDGLMWTQMMVGPTTKELIAVWGLSATDVYAVGLAGTLLHYDGMTWSSSIVPPGAHLSGIWGTATSDLFVTGRNGLFHFDGVSWSPVRLFSLADAVAIAGAGDSVFTLDRDGQATRLLRTIPW